MKLSPEDIQKLTLDEISGTLSTDEKEKLYNSISKDSELYNIWKSVHEYFSSPVVQNAVTSLMDNLTIQEIKNRINLSRRRTLFRITGLAAAASILISIVVMNWLWQPTTVYQNFNIEHGLTEDEPELILPNGQKINLTKNQKRVNLPGLSINNVNDSLTYTATNYFSNFKAFALLKIPAKQNYQIRLSDGTEVWLNSLSSLQFPISFTEGSRLVQLHGEAYFKVSQNSEVPFTVKLSHCTVTVLGTEFNVNAYDSNKVNIALVNGAVKISNSNNSTLLSPGQEAILNSELEMEVRNYDSDILKWRQGIYVFQNASLSEVLDIIPRWYGRRIVIENPKVTATTFFGIVDRKQPVESLLDRLKTIYKFSYSQDKDGVIYIRQ